MIKEEMRDRARQLRKSSTSMENQFWNCVRNGRFGKYKFRRQQVIGPYIVDFVCHRVKLIIELDGSQHIDAHEYDRRRDEWLKSQDYRVVRVWNHEWVRQRVDVLEKIWCELERGPHP